MRRTSLGALYGLSICAAALTTSDAKAHFRLEAPTNMTAQDGSGNPQKSAPCGDEVGTITTGVITAFEPGETITITIDETIFHPGHYRVTLSEAGPDGLPEAPPVTPTPSDQCAMTEIQDPPVYPVLADGMLPHDAPFDGEQTFEVTLPDEITCENCVLQVTQFMSSHGAPCFYYHCAEISIGVGAAETTGDPSTTTGDPTGGDESTSGAPATTSASSAGNSDTGTPDPSAGGDDSAAGSSSSAGTGTDGMGQDDNSGGGGGCSTHGGGAGLLALLPLLFATRRRWC